MILESVDRGFVDAIVRTLTSLREGWRLPEDAWAAFQDWSLRRRGRPAARERVLYHHVQDLYEFAIETRPDRDEAELLRLCGRSFARDLLQERLSEFMRAAAGHDVLDALDGLFQRFMHQYSPYVFRSSTTRRGRELRMSLRFSDREAIEAYLTPYGKNLDECFRRSFQMMLGTIEGCLGYLLLPWDPKNVTGDVGSGTVRAWVPEKTEFNVPELLRALAGFAQEAQRRHERERLSLEMESDLVLRSAGSRALWQRVRVAAASDELILLRGEPGTGKTHLARRIHELSPRRSGPFVEVGLTSDLGADNLLQSDLFGHVKGAFTSASETKKGLFAVADGGTIFLDEIGDAGPELQAKLLRVIERKVFKPLGAVKDASVDVRIVAATNRDLEARMREGAFRADLFHRLNVIPIDLPPLREREAELPLLSEHLMRLVAIELKKPGKPLSPSAAALLRAYAWPGNLRELIHVLKHALLFGEHAEIEPRDLPDAVRRGAPRPKSVAAPAGEDVVDVERLRAALAEADGCPLPKEPWRSCPWHIDYAKRVYLASLLRHCRGNLREVAKRWDRASVTTLRALLKKFDLLGELAEARKLR